jgi:hypothetical protein
VENQHRKITGYRDLTQNEIDAMNSIKALAEKVGDIVSNMESSLGAEDKRWVAIGKTHLQQGFMALTRAVARPGTF